MKSLISIGTILIFLNLSSAIAADNLGSTIRQFGWERIIGTWGDAETKGKIYKSTTKWKFKDHLIETLNQNFHENKKEFSLMGYNPKKKEAFHISSDNKGGSSIGNWTFNKNEAFLNLLFITGEKQEGALKIKYTLVDNNTMEATILLPEPIMIKMVRIEKSKPLTNHWTE
tara:strand:+ start:85 stop:597 length:513 start_codon:yes stop_codon:yes gene_type:complete